LVWGECLNATPPPPEADSEIPNLRARESVSPDEAGEIPDDEFLQTLIEDIHQDIRDSGGIVAASRIKASGPERPRTSGAPKCMLSQYPHACLAISEAATWGSAPSTITDTDVPSTSDLTELAIGELEDFDCFDDEFVCHSIPCRSFEDLPDPVSDEIGERTHGENELPTQGEPVTLGPQRIHVMLIMRSHSIEPGVAREVEDEKLYGLLHPRVIGYVVYTNFLNLQLGLHPHKRMCILTSIVERLCNSWRRKIQGNE
jgi:hypothetical protein